MTVKIVKYDAEPLPLNYQVFDHFAANQTSKLF